MSKIGILNLQGCKTEIRPIKKNNEPLNKDHIIELLCSLKEIYNGTVKKEIIYDKHFDIEIKKGYRDGTKITYNNILKSKTFFNIINLIFIIKYKFDNNIIIDNDNIIYTINKKEFKNTNKKYILTIPHPEKELKIKIDNIKISNEIIISNKGLYNRKNNNYGDFIIKII